MARPSIMGGLQPYGPFEWPVPHTSGIVFQTSRLQRRSLASASSAMQYRYRIAVFLSALRRDPNMRLQCSALAAGPSPAARDVLVVKPLCRALRTLMISCEVSREAPITTSSQNQQQAAKWGQFLETGAFVPEPLRPVAAWLTCLAGQGRICWAPRRVRQASAPPSFVRKEESLDLSTST
ncbi:hypothetical protein N658DRAFT_179028 [Parathielavia hyrcaniae]|uniref:Uncharacterized protein n=1 Tax=Parathielavia hyrcaniae TaxID=113614 RepID=A0AAN6T4H5_9PEZI|nr:hypothetical protein N658DRAFT_179028 [Parathielavia hyrcaniae]